MQNPPSFQRKSAILSSKRSCRERDLSGPSRALCALSQEAAPLPVIYCSESSVFNKATLKDNKM
jgi:hypothetical protein